jgi:hypothetical protein
MRYSSRVRRLFIVLGVVSGCALEEGGLLPGDASYDTAFDAPTHDATVDANAADAVTDALQATDAVADAPAEATYDAGVEAGPIVTITGGPYTLLGVDAGVCSMNANTPTAFDLTNDRDASVDLIWVNYTCGEQPYGVIVPLGMQPQSTYVTHVWRIRNQAVNAFLAEFVLNAAGTYAVTVH